jgi:hypothetical protein
MIVAAAHRVLATPAERKSREFYFGGSLVRSARPPFGETTVTV